MAGDEWDPAAEAEFTPAFVQKYLEIKGLPCITYDEEGNRNVEIRYLGREPVLPSIAEAREIQEIGVDEMWETGTEGWARVGVRPVSKWLPSGELVEEYPSTQIDQPYARYTIVDLFVSQQGRMPDVMYDGVCSEIVWDPRNVPAKLEVIKVLSVAVEQGSTITPILVENPPEFLPPPPTNEAKATHLEDLEGAPISRIFTLTPKSLGLTPSEVKQSEEEAIRSHISLEGAFEFFHLRRGDIIRHAAYLRVDDILLDIGDFWDTLFIGQKNSHIKRR